MPFVSLFLFGPVLFDAVSSLVFCSCFFLPFVLVCKEGLSKALCERKVLGPWPGLFLKMWQWLWSQELPVMVPVSLGSHPDHPTPSHTDRKPSLTQRPLHTERNFLYWMIRTLASFSKNTSDMQSASCEQVCVWQGKQLVNINGCSDMPKCLSWMIASGKQSSNGIGSLALLSVSGSV